MAVSSSRTSKSPRCTTSPFSFSTCSTTADISARRSARRSGCTVPVMVGPEVSALLATVNRSSGESSRGRAEAAFLSTAAGALLQAARVSMKNAENKASET